MRITLEKLYLIFKNQNQNQKLLPVYLIASDEPCLIYEAEDIIRDHAKKSGFSERDIFDVDSKFNWSLFVDSTTSLSLFSTYKIIEMRFQSKPDLTAQKYLLNYFEKMQQDILLLLRCPKLDNTNLKSKWISSLEKVGGILILNRPKKDELSNWIAKRANILGIKLNSEVIHFLSNNNEGNLLSIIQELMQIKELYSTDSTAIIVDMEKLKHISNNSNNNSRFEVFDLVDSILNADLKRVKRIIENLEQNNNEAVLVNWALQKEISIFSKMILLESSGQSCDSALLGLWETRKNLYKNAYKRFNIERIKILSQMSVEIDKSIKGAFFVKNPWNLILRLSFALAGRSFLPLSSNPNI